MTRAAAIAALLALAGCGSRNEDRPAAPPVADAATPAPEPPRYQTAEDYLHFLHEVVKTIGTRLERMGHEVKPCRGDADARAWHVDFAALVQLTGGDSAPEGFGWLTDHRLVQIAMGQDPLLDLPPVLLVIRPETRAPDRLRGMVYAIDNATGDLLCHAPISVEGDLPARFPEALAEARRQMQGPPPSP